MKIRKNILSADEMLVAISKQWATTKDIQDIANVGWQKAKIIKDSITQELEKQKKWLLPPGLVPMDKVVEYLRINTAYLKKVAKGKE